MKLVDITWIQLNIILLKHIPLIWPQPSQQLWKGDVLEWGRHRSIELRTSGATGIFAVSNSDDEFSYDDSVICFEGLFMPVLSPAQIPAAIKISRAVCTICHPRLKDISLDAS